MILEEYDEELHKKSEAEYWTSVGLEQGLQRGLTRGRKEGRKEGLEAAKKIFHMSARGIAPEEISKEMGISVNEVRQILE